MSFYSRSPSHAGPDVIEHLRPSAGRSGCSGGWDDMRSPTSAGRRPAKQRRCVQRAVAGASAAPDKRRLATPRRTRSGPGRPPPERRASRVISAARKGRQATSSSGVGLLSGGAHRHAAEMYASVSVSPSSRPREVGWLANPARCSAAYRKSPELSPVNIRPVRLAPCAPGARPTIRTRASGSPKPGTGLPQYAFIPVRAALYPRHLLPPGDQARAEAAGGVCWIRELTNRSSQPDNHRPGIETVSYHRPSKIK